VHDQRRRTGLLVISAVAVGAVIAHFVFRAEPETLTISTATEGGTFYALGIQLARILEDHPERLLDEVVAIKSGGSAENIDRLLSGEADIAFASRNALNGFDADSRAGLRVLARLYSDDLHLVARRDGPAHTTGLRGARVALGPRGSGTRNAAERVVASMSLTSLDFRSEEPGGFDDIADALFAGNVDAAFFSAGTPIAAVRTLMQSGEFHLLPLDDVDVPIDGYTRKTLPAFTYENQTADVASWGTDVFLVSRADLEVDTAFLIIKSIFDNLRELLDAHPAAQHIKLSDAFGNYAMPERMALHPGASEFVSWAEDTLVIATGAMSGKYYELGRMLQRLLAIRGIASFVVHTDGSIENAEILASGRPALAIMQYDAALAARAGVSVYSFDASEITDVPRIPEVRGLRRIAALHEDRIHVFARRALMDELSDDGVSVNIATLEMLAERGESLRVWLGPEKSGSRILSQAILHHHGMHLSDVDAQFMSDSDMLMRYYSGEIDLGFFASHVPSHVLGPLVDDTDTILLSLAPKARVALLGSALSATVIEAGTYACQLEGSPEIQTVATRALLVTTEKVAADVSAITEALFDGEAFLGVPGGGDAMAEHIPSIPLHDEAEAYYLTAGYLPATPSFADVIFEWLSVTWRFFAVIAIVVAACKGGLEVKREFTAHDFYRRALSVDAASEEANKAGDLIEMRGQISERVVRRSWAPGEIDRGRWRELHDLINELLADQKETWSRKLLSEVRAVLDDPGLDDADRASRLVSLEARVVSSVETGALDAAQFALFQSLFSGARAGDSSAGRSREQGARSSPEHELGDAPA